MGSSVVFAQCSWKRDARQGPAATIGPHAKSSARAARAEEMTRGIAWGPGRVGSERAQSWGGGDASSRLSGLGDGCAAALQEENQRAAALQRAEARDAGSS